MLKRAMASLTDAVRRGDKAQAARCSRVTQGFVGLFLCFTGKKSIAARLPKAPVAAELASDIVGRVWAKTITGDSDVAKQSHQIGAARPNSAEITVAGLLKTNDKRCSSAARTSVATVSSVVWQSSRSGIR